MRNVMVRVLTPLFSFDDSYRLSRSRLEQLWRSRGVEWKAGLSLTKVGVERLKALCESVDGKGWRAYLSSALFIANIFFPRNVLVGWLPRI